MDTITAEITLTGGGDRSPFDDEPWSHHAWTVKLTYQGRTMVTPFYTGDMAGEPTARAVLERLLSAASSAANAESFEDWCYEYGYDTDSRRAERTYNATVKQTDALRELLGDDFDAAIFPTDGDQERVVRRLAPVGD